VTKRDQRQREWMTRVTDYKASGLTMAAWCTSNHVTLEQLKYWTRKFKTVASMDTVSSTARFVPLSVTESVPSLISASIVVRVGHASITLQQGFDPQLLREAVTALSETC